MPLSECAASTGQTFTGFPFDDDRARFRQEARRLLAQAMGELRRDDRLHAVGADLSALGRDAIKDTDDPWDYIRLKCSAGEPDHSIYPHFTLTLRPTHLLAVLILPDNMRTAFRHNLAALGLDGFRAAIATVSNALTTLFGDTPDAVPYALVQQRRWPTRSGAPLTDALIEFDLRTALRPDERTSPEQRPVKCQHQWLDAAYDALTHKKSNLEIAVGAKMLYGSAVVKSRDVIPRIADAWIATVPLLEATGVRAD